MDTHFKNNALSWGAGGAKWLQSIPDIISRYEHVWSFKAQAPFELNYNYVAPVICSNGLRAVLKIGYPKDPEFQSEIAALRCFDGNKSCRLLHADEKNAVMLLERIVPGTPVAEVKDDAEATRIIATIAKQLHKPLPKSHDFITVEK